MKKIGFILSVLSFGSYAVEVQPLWGKLPASMNQHSMQSQMQRLPSPKGHTRYQQFYKGIPVWGYQLIAHANGTIPYTGYWLSGLDTDLNSITPQLSQDAIKKKFVDKKSKSVTIQKIIYVADKKAKLAYHVKYYTMKNHQLSHINKIIDANDGVVYKTFDAIHRARIGQGPGGAYNTLPMRAGDFQYGDITLKENALGRFDVTQKDGNCVVGNKNIEIVSLQNIDFNWSLFPISASKQEDYQTFFYPCNRTTQFINVDDGGYAPTNKGLSPINDAMYFAQATLDMYQLTYGDDKPLGEDLPIRIYTHLAGLDNAFSLDTNSANGRIISHQQVVIGNGQHYFAPMSQTTIPHELSHNVTSNYSNLIYEGHSGGINEAFSDMADLALRDYLSKSYPWYWDRNDWSIGREETLTGTPLRYMEKPSDDGRSIDYATDYRKGMNVHHSSGVFNRAFFLLAHEPGWNAKKAFQVMFNANRYYWIPNTNFNFAACGVIQATKDMGWDVSKVEDAFSQVKVKCSVKLKS